MAAADDLWTAVKDRYDDQALIGLTNVRDRAKGTIDDAVGVQAASDVIGYFPIYVQTTYDEASVSHLNVGIRGVLAVLWMRGGTSAQIQRVKWEDWINEAKELKNVEPRGHAVPESNSTLTPSPECGGIQPCRPWADPMFFRGLLPRRGVRTIWGGPCEWD